MFISKDDKKLIDRLSEIEKINSWEKSFEKEHGIAPYNISSWNVSKSFRESLRYQLDWPQLGDEIDYIYTYSLGRGLKEKIINKILEHQDSNSTIIITPNNTISIVNIAKFLKSYGYHNVCILNPSYFSVSQAFQTMDISYQIVNLIRQDGDYILPLEKILTQNFDAVWLTSPVYSTGVYFSDKEFTKIQFLIDSGVMVIADESFALNGYELIRHILPGKHFIGIYSPHKAICCNGIKFSAIITSDEYEDFFEQWVDVLSGNLPQSSIIAAHHFVTDNYDNCNIFFQTKTNSIRTNILNYTQELPKEIDRNSAGNLMTLYFKHIPYMDTINYDFCTSLFRKTFSSFYPGFLNGFGRDIGFCFRINLALDSPDFFQATYKVILYLINN